VSRQFNEEQRPELNRAWLEALMQDTNKTGDLRISAEVPQTPTDAEGASHL
jgi:hypothetical protein